MSSSLKPILFRSVVGLDIGQSSVKIARVSRIRGSCGISHLDTLRIPQGMGWTEVAGMIRRWIEKKGLSRESFIIGLRGMSSVLQTMVLPPQDPRPAEKAVEVEIARLGELSNESMTYGFTDIQGSDKSRRFLVSLARVEKISELLDITRNAGLDVVDVIPVPCALFSAMNLFEPGGKGRTTCYVDIGQTATEVAIGSSEGLKFARGFGMGGRHFNDAIVKTGKITYAQAEAAKVASGLDQPEEARKQSLFAAAESWASELKSCISVYRSFFPSEEDRPLRIVLSGGGCRLKGLDRFLGNMFGMEVSIFSSIPGNGKVEDPAPYAVACGLALAGTGKGGRHISLLPADIRESLLLRKQKGYWVGVGVMTVLTLAISMFGGYRDYMHKSMEVAEQAESLERCRKLGRKIERIEQVNGRLEEMSKTVLTLMRNGPVYGDVLNAIGDKMSTNCWITLMADANSYFSQDNPVKPEARRVPRGISENKGGNGGVIPGEIAFTRLIVEGYTSDRSLSSVSRLIDFLKADKVIGKADLLGDDQLVEEDVEKWADAGDRRFVIDITL